MSLQVNLLFQGTAENVASEMSNVAEKIRERTTTLIGKLMQKPPASEFSEESSVSQTDFNGDFSPFTNGSIDAENFEREKVFSNKTQENLSGSNTMASTSSRSSIPDDAINASLNTETPPLDITKNEMLKTVASSNINTSNTGSASAKQSRDFHHSVSQPIMDDLISDIYGVSLNQSEKRRELETQRKPAVRPVIRPMGGDIHVGPKQEVRA